VTGGNGLFIGISIKITLGNYLRFKIDRSDGRLKGCSENISTMTEKLMEIKY
jgi:hypothetical protein